MDQETPVIGHFLRSAWPLFNCVEVYITSLHFVMFFIRENIFCIYSASKPITGQYLRQEIFFQVFLWPKTLHKSDRIWSYSGLYSIERWENADQNNSECGHFLRSETVWVNNAFSINPSSDVQKYRNNHNIQHPWINQKLALLKNCSFSNLQVSKKGFSPLFLLIE